VNLRRPNLTAATAPPPCPGCGRRHRTRARLAECLFDPEWVIGEGPWGCFAWRPRGLTIVLHRTRPEADESKRRVDETRCGGCCVADHTVKHVAEAARRGGVQ
jgi:hypothetical protein